MSTLLEDGELKDRLTQISKWNTLLVILNIRILIGSNLALFRVIVAPLTLKTLKNILFVKATLYQLTAPLINNYQTQLILLNALDLVDEVEEAL